MDSEALKTAFTQAAEIASAVPQALRETAFNRALDALLGGSVAAGGGADSKAGKKKPKHAKTQKQKEPGDADNDPFKYLTEHLDRTAHPEITSAPRVLERALWLLRVSKDAHGIDGLGSTHIAKLLTEKFRLRTTKQAVQQALDSARNYVDRHSPQSGRLVYRIMHGGENYLDSPKAKDAKFGKAAHIVRTPRRAEKTEARKPKHTLRATADRPPTKGSATKRAGAIVGELIGEGFFKKPRTIRSVIDHAKGSLGYHLKANELSPPLLRALRGKKLKRSQNSDGQYEYSET